MSKQNDDTARSYVKDAENRATDCRNAGQDAFAAAERGDFARCLTDMERLHEWSTDLAFRTLMAKRAVERAIATKETA